MSVHSKADSATGAVPLASDAAGALLRDVVRAATGSGGVVAFDLDSTLLDNRPRQALILREYGESVSEPRLTGSRAHHWKGWDEGIPMRAVGLSEREADDHREPFKDFWRQRFFTSDYCRVDTDIAGAVAFVVDVASGAKVVYLTGRHEPMRDGTLESFSALGFPMLDDKRVQLVMKPTLEESDDHFKERAYAELRAIGTVVAAFDNEPTHINGYRRVFPDAMCVHLATDHSLREVKVAAGIPSVRDFSAYQRD